LTVAKTIVEVGKVYATLGRSPAPAA